MAMIYSVATMLYQHSHHLTYPLQNLKKLMILSAVDWMFVSPPPNSYFAVLILHGILFGGGVLGDG